MNHHGDFALGATEENHGPASEVLLHPQVHCRYITTKSGDLLNHTFWCYDVLDTSSIDYQTLRVERWMTSESIIFRDQTWPVMFQDTVLGQLKHLSLTACENGPTEKLYHEILDRYDIL